MSLLTETSVKIAVALEFYGRINPMLNEEHFKSLKIPQERIPKLLTVLRNVVRRLYGRIVFKRQLRSRAVTSNATQQRASSNYDEVQLSLAPRYAFQLDCKKVTFRDRHLTVGGNIEIPYKSIVECRIINTGEVVLKSDHAPPITFGVTDAAKVLAAVSSNSTRLLRVKHEHDHDHHHHGHHQRQHEARSSPLTTRHLCVVSIQCA